MREQRIVGSAEIQVLGLSNALPPQHLVDAAQAVDGFREAVIAITVKRSVVLPVEIVDRGLAGLPGARGAIHDAPPDREEGLSVRRRKRKRIGAVERQPSTIPTGANQRWSIDFVSDGLGDGRKFRSLNIVNFYSRECVAAEGRWTRRFQERGGSGAGAVG